MPAIPESTRSSIIVRLLDHAEHNWPQLTKVQARYHGSFAYITGVLPGGEQIPLLRLRYGGSAHSFGFAIYSPARDRYEDAVRSPDSLSAARKKHSTPPAPSTSQRSDTNPNPDPRRTYGVTHLATGSYPKETRRHGQPAPTMPRKHRPCSPIRVPGQHAAADPGPPQPAPAKFTPAATTPAGEKA